MAARREATLATISWISTTGGDWSDGANWQGGVVPGPADDAVMSLSNAETITVSMAETVQSVSFDDPAATFIETALGTLDASGNVTIDAASLTFDGKIAAGSTVTLNAGGDLSLGTVPPNTGTLVAGLLIGTVGTISVGGVVSPDVQAANTIAAPGTLALSATGLIDAGPIVIASAPDPEFNIEPANLITDAGSFGWPYQPVLTVAPANSTPPPLGFIVLTPDTVPAAASFAPFSSWKPAFLGVVPPCATPTWGLAIPTRSFGSGAPTVVGSGDGAIVTATGYRPEILAPGAGNETLLAGAGNDTLVAGNGATEMTGGSGSTEFLFSNGAGGVATISNFVHGQDFVALRDYGSNAVQGALASAAVEGGSATVTLPDNSRITFANIATLTADDFR